jgi:serpin B
MVVMPDGKLADLESTWSKQTLQAGLQQLHPTQIRLRMPQWKISRRENWNTVLKRIGLGVAFSDKANFAGIDGAQDLALGQVVEQSWISVDEMGTEASSASAATLIVKGIREEPTEVSINRPFLFLIYDRASDQILFMGRVVDPTAESR